MLRCLGPCEFLGLDYRLVKILKRLQRDHGVGRENLTRRRPVVERVKRRVVIVEDAARTRRRHGIGRARSQLGGLTRRALVQCEVLDLVAVACIDDLLQVGQLIFGEPRVDLEVHALPGDAFDLQLDWVGSRRRRRRRLGLGHGPRDSAVPKRACDG